MVGARRHPQQAAVVAAAIISALVIALVVARVSSAGFSGTTDSPGNNWSAGVVAITDDDSSAAMFSTANEGLLDGGQSLTKCIAVTYSGTITTDVSVRTYATASGALAPYLDLKVEEGWGASSASCAGFNTGSTLYDGTLAGYATAHGTFADGASTWQPTSTPQTRVYRFTATVQNSAAAQAKSATATFAWEAQSGVVAAPLGYATADDLADATALPMPTLGAPVVADYDSSGATYEQGELDNWYIYDDQTPGIGSIWYRFTPTIDTWIEINTFNGNLPGATVCDTYLTLYEGWDYDHLWDDESNDNVTSGDPAQTCPQQSRLYYQVQPGTDYFIQVLGATPGDQGIGRLTLAQVAPPANDAFADAATIAPLASGSVQVPFEARNATFEAGEPEEFTGTGSSVWFKYIPSVNQTLTVGRPDFASPFAIYTGGPTVAGLTRAAGNMDDPGNPIRDISVPVTAGQTYWVQVGFYPGQQYGYDLTVSVS